MRWIIFDYAGVLGLHQPEAIKKEMAKVAAVDEAVFWGAYWQHREAYDEGRISDERYWKLVGLSSSASLDESAIHHLTDLDIASWLEPNLDLIEAVQSMAELEDSRIAVLSNAPASLADAVEKQPWLEFIPTKLFSCHMGVAKPKPECYQLALDALRTVPDHVIFVDDRQDNIRAAEEQGIRGITYTRLQDFINAISTNSLD